MLHLSDFVELIKKEIGDQLEADDELDPRLILQVNGLMLEVDESTCNGLEIVLKPRTAPGFFL